MWIVQFHELVIDEDFKKIDPAQKELILKAIYKKLSLDPQSYGKPLQGELSGCWRLRVGNYRVVYKIVKEEIIVMVIKVGIRRDEEVYKELLTRLKKI